jgi:DNA-binding MarR family transcriptional regulator
VPPTRGLGGVAFLLAQLGAHAAMRFAERIRELDLSPPQAGLLRMIAASPGESQQTYAGRLGTPPSRFVGLVDELEGRGLIERRRGEQDRRAYALHLTGPGERLLADLGKVGHAHEEDITAALTADERAALRELLARVAAQQQLTPGVHPGFRHLGGPSILSDLGDRPTSS